MEAFTALTAGAVPLDLPNIDFILNQAPYRGASPTPLTCWARAAALYGAFADAFYATTRRGVRTASATSSTMENWSR